MPYYFLLGFLPLEKTVTYPSSMGWFHTGEYLHHQPYCRFWGPPKSYVEMHLLWACHVPSQLERFTSLFFRSLWSLAPSGVDLWYCRLSRAAANLCLYPALEIQSVPISSGESETSLRLRGSHPKSWNFTHTFYLPFPSWRTSCQIRMNLAGLGEGLQQVKWNVFLTHVYVALLGFELSWDTGTS